ncbi:hypothetical protein EXN66_Car006030 [Channa argus]|uniref:Uncharacterized protein n=1 Tax=Channa argus TaxID=215402 RepID=A0A6G1PK37_CHAAH|nr:hypothetical protein EXN66_Car006030 [Channa argus]
MQIIQEAIMNAQLLFLHHCTAVKVCVCVCADCCQKEQNNTIILQTKAKGCSVLVEPCCNGRQEDGGQSGDKDGGDGAGVKYYPSL